MSQQKGERARHALADNALKTLSLYAKSLEEEIDKDVAFLDEEKKEVSE